MIVFNDTIFLKLFCCFPFFSFIFYDVPYLSLSSILTDQDVK